ncbi:hypothetical protein Bbelb_378590 [Branchiostoma belcheri]|nr:hypothetical protein Bbelb_378590 [Branchiostoma belcheri]
MADRGNISTTCRAKEEVDLPEMCNGLGHGQLGQFLELPRASCDADGVPHKGAKKRETHRTLDVAFRLSLLYKDTILCCGDGLSIERMVHCKRARSNGGTQTARLQGLLMREPRSSIGKSFFSK